MRRGGTINDEVFARLDCYDEVWYGECRGEPE
jgi:hypothetical protein